MTKLNPDTSPTYGDIRYWAECPGGKVYYKMMSVKQPRINASGEEALSILEDIILTLTAENMKKHKIEVE